MKPLSVAAAAAALSAVLQTAGMTTPASAAWCGYHAYSPLLGKVHSGIQGNAYAARKSTSCKRAERRCIRKLRRAWNRGEAQSYGCIRIEQER